MIVIDGRGETRFDAVYFFSPFRFVLFTIEIRVQACIFSWRSFIFLFISMIPHAIQ